jgi:hypothetical protein
MAPATAAVFPDQEGTFSMGSSIVEAVAFFDSIEFNDFWVRVAPDPA